MKTAILLETSHVVTQAESFAVDPTPGDYEVQEIVDRTCPTSGLPCNFPACANGSCAMKLAEVVAPDLAGMSQPF